MNRTCKHCGALIATSDTTLIKTLAQSSFAYALTCNGCWTEEDVDFELSMRRKIEDKHYVGTFVKITLPRLRIDRDKIWEELK